MNLADEFSGFENMGRGIGQGLEAPGSWTPPFVNPFADETTAAEESAAAARDIEELLEIVLQGDQPPEDDGEGRRGLSPNFLATLCALDDLPEPDEWLLPPAAEPVVGRRVVRFSEPERCADDAQAGAEAAMFGSVVPEMPPVQLSQPPYDQRYEEPATSFEFLIPTIDNVPVEGGDGSPEAKGVVVTTGGGDGGELKRATSESSDGASSQDNVDVTSRYRRKRQRRVDDSDRPAVCVKRTELANRRPRVNGRFISQPSNFKPVTEM
ncbi:hypothetical protein JKP88DRAFT_284177 [Tribonema minus]|uniref:CCT domain-containing protein n=1 Tax=Tribonema minus TaxID=303371 RepID=A0A836CN83_9STRA|nr:hypothetical protein JKP88DRAFT_284177 [Tribonema minus]